MTRSHRNGDIPCSVSLLTNRVKDLEPMVDVTWRERSMFISQRFTALCTPRSQSPFNIKKCTSNCHEVQSQIICPVWTKILDILKLVIFLKNTFPLWMTSLCFIDFNRSLNERLSLIAELWTIVCYSSGLQTNNKSIIQLQIATYYMWKHICTYT